MPTPSSPRSLKKNPATNLIHAANSFITAQRSLKGLSHLVPFRFHEICRLCQVRRKRQAGCQEPLQDEGPAASDDESSSQVSTNAHELSPRGFLKRERISFMNPHQCFIFVLTEPLFILRVAHFCSRPSQDSEEHLASISKHSRTHTLPRTNPIGSFWAAGSAPPPGGWAGKGKGRGKGKGKRTR